MKKALALALLSTVLSGAVLTAAQAYDPNHPHHQWHHHQWKHHHHWHK